jgi:hypothetical protein
MLLVVSVAVLQPHILTLAWVTRCITALIVSDFSAKIQTYFVTSKFFPNIVVILVMVILVKIDFGYAVICSLYININIYIIVADFDNQFSILTILTLTTLTAFRVFLRPAWETNFP